MKSPMIADAINDPQKIVLAMAPMEGVLDWPMRRVLAPIADVDYFVTEFMRITDQVFPDREFHKYCPELQGRAEAGHDVPVGYQLLGGSPERVAANAARAQYLGASSIDLNFGCPAKTVNRHDGGASLLQFPTRIFDITRATRTALQTSLERGPSTTLSVKMRLGFMDKSLMKENFAAAEEGGAQWITIHGRTKEQMYKPYADWESIASLQAISKVPIFANGDIFTVADFIRCRAVTGAQHFMMGRGLLQNPLLVREIKSYLKKTESGGASRIVKSEHDDSSLMDRDVILKELLRDFFVYCYHYRSLNYAVSRMKQWLGSLKMQSPIAANIFERVKVHRELIFEQELFSALGYSTDFKNDRQSDL